MMGDGTPIPCTTINRNVMVSHYVVAGSKNPLPLGMGSVNSIGPATPFPMVYKMAEVLGVDPSDVKEKTLYNFAKEK